MNGFILGFQRRVWWPKWTPASSSCRIEVDGTGATSWFGCSAADLVAGGRPVAPREEGLGERHRPGRNDPRVSSGTGQGAGHVDPQVRTLRTPESSTARAQTPGRRRQPTWR
jgi:hypothetical protein